jgi:heme-degrading monooxygenase HmoA
LERIWWTRVEQAGLQETNLGPSEIKEPVVAYNIIWEFRVPSERVADFEATYGADGAWALLFRRAEGFLGVELLHSTEQPGRYLTVDRWASQSAFEAFRARFVADYEALDERLADLATTETRLGAFASVGPVEETPPARCSHPSESGETPC